MDVSINKDKRDDIINSLRKLEGLITQTKRHRILYSQTQMKVFSILHATFEQRLEILDSSNANQGINHAKN